MVRGRATRGPEKKSIERMVLDKDHGLKDGVHTRYRAENANNPASVLIAIQLKHSPLLIVMAAVHIAIMPHHRAR
jgi:hypothetical protein